MPPEKEEFSPETICAGLFLNSRNKNKIKNKRFIKFYVLIRKKI